MAEKPAIRSLAKKDFSSDEFMAALAANLERKKKKSEDEWEDITPKEDEWETLEPISSESSTPLAAATSDIDSYKPEGSADSGGIWGFIEKATSPLTNLGERGREFEKEYSAAFPIKEEIQATGKGDLQDWLAWLEATGKGFARGAQFEGAGAAIDQLTAPTDLVGLGAGGAAVKLGAKGLPKVANLLRRITQVSGLPNVAHGSSVAKEGVGELYDSKDIWDVIKGGGKTAAGAFEAAMGGAQMHFPKSAITPRPAKKTAGIGETVDIGGKKYKITGVDERGKPKVKLVTDEPAGDVPLVPTEKATPADSARIDELSAKVQADTATPDEISELAAAFDDMFGVTPNTRPLSAEAQAFSGRDAAGNLRTADDVVNAASKQAEADAGGLPKSEDVAAELRAGTSGSDIIAKMFPEMTGREPKRTLTMDQAPAAPKGRPPLSMKDIDTFLKDEKGELDLSRLFQGEEDLGYSVRTNDPNSVELGEIPKQDIDLEAAALEAGSDTARPVNPIMRFLADEKGEIDLSALFNRPGESEFSPDLRQIDEPEFGGTSTRFEPRVPRTEERAGIMDRIRNFMADESGEIRFGGKDQANVWESLPDNVKDFFQERGVGPEDTAGKTLKEVSDDYDTALKIIAEQKAAQPVSKAKQAQLVKKSGERVDPQAQLDPNAAFGPEGDIAPIVEAKRSLDLNKAADFRYKNLLPESMQHKLASGETYADRLNLLLESSQPFTPEMNAEVADFKQSLESAPDARMEKYESRIPDQPDRRGIPLLRRNALPERLKKLLGDESGEIDLSAIFGEESSIGNFLRDESGEIRFDIPPSKPKDGAPRVRMLGEESLDPELPVIEREAPAAYEPSKLRQAFDLPVGLMSIDLPFMTSAAFRQASPLAWTEAWFDAWGKAAKAYGSESAAEIIENEIRNSEFFKPRYKPIYDANGNITKYKEMPSIAESLGVRMTDYKHITNREELIRSQLAEKIPFWGPQVVKRSNRAYSAFLNSLRKAQFEKLMNQATWAGEGAKDFVTAKNIAEFVNDATGRSTLKVDLPGGSKGLNFEKNADALAKALWSPRLLASRVKFLNPATYMNAAPEIRQEYINGLLRSIGTWWAFAGMASMMGAQVNKDVSNADFGKIRIGNTRIDPGAGFQQLLVFGARMAPEIEGLDTGKFTSSTSGKTTRYGEGYKPRTRFDTAVEFGASKLHPMAKIAFDLLRATKDRPVHLGDRAVEMMLPMMTQDIMETFESDPDLAYAIAPLSSIGMGTSTYDRQSFNEPVFSNKIEEYLGMQPGSLAGTIGR